MRRPAVRAGSWLVSHPVDVVFALLVGAAFAYTLRITGRSYFFVDEWLVIRQAGSVAHFLDPYNNSLSLASFFTDRVLAETFGFDYTPFRVVGLLGLFGIPAGYFLTTRRQFGALLAALLALPLLWYGRYASFFPGELNHNLALLGAIGCAAALNRGRRADWVLAAALMLSLGSAGGGVAVAAACLTHNACTRAPVRRWVAVLVPTLLYVTWWLIAVGEATDLGPYSMTTTQTIQLARDLAYSAFESAALGNPAFAVGLVVAFAAYGIWALAKGLSSGANFVAWSIGVVVWAVGLANSRGLFADITTFRYRFTALGLILLAVVPRRPIVWPARFRIETDRRWAYAAAGAILVLGCARGLAVRSDVQSVAKQFADIGRVTRAEALVLGLGPEVVPDGTKLPFRFGSLRAADIRALYSDYDNPLPATRGSADQRLVDMGIIGSAVIGTRHTPCSPLTQPFRSRATALGDAQTLWSPDAPFAVDIRRFGDHWVRLERARPGELLRITLPGLNSAKPWEIRADGACRVGPATG